MKIFYPLFFCCAAMINSYAQAPVYDTAFLTSAKANIIQRYTDYIQEQSNLFQGSAYVEPKRTLEHHPFFEQDDWVTGSVTYSGSVYQNIPLMYDIYADKLVTENFYHREIALVNERISAFTFGHHRFERLYKNETNNLPVTGFYEILYNGSLRVVARYFKQHQDKIQNNSIQREYNLKKRYFLVRGGTYYPLRTKASLLKLLPDKKRELKAAYSKNKNTLRGNKAATFVFLTQQYDTITPVP